MKTKLHEALANFHVVSSYSEVRRLLYRGGVKINGTVASEDATFSPGDTVSLGKHRHYFCVKPGELIDLSGREARAEQCQFVTERDIVRTLTNAESAEIRALVSAYAQVRDVVDPVVRWFKTDSYQVLHDHFSHAIGQRERVGVITNHDVEVAADAACSYFHSIATPESIPASVLPFMRAPWEAATGDILVPFNGRISEK